MSIARQHSRTIRIGEDDYRWTVTEAARGAGLDLLVIIESEDPHRRGQLRAELPSAERREGDCVTPGVVRNLITAARQAGWTPDGGTRDVFVLRDLAAHISVVGRAGKCAKCGRLLTSALQPLTPPSVLDCDDGHDMVPSSHYTTSDGDFFPEGWIVLNLRDARNVRPHPDGTRRSGCCGPGAEIGIEKADCWLPRGLALDPEVTRFLDVTADE